MKLYATIESERAKPKSGGGNDFITIRLQDNRGVVARIDYKPLEIQIWDARGIRFHDTLLPLHGAGNIPKHTSTTQNDNQ